MGDLPVVFPDYESWSFPGGAVLAHRSVVAPVREALSQRRTLYEWAAHQASRDVFTGRGEAYGVQLGGTRAVVRHARRGGALARLLGDRYLGAPRFVREIDTAQRLARAGVPTPAVLAGVRYPAGLVHRADVATERVDGTDLVTLFFSPTPPRGGIRTAIFHAVGALVRRLHNAGFVHPDLHLRNVLIELSSSAALPPYRPAAWLLDVDTCRVTGPEDDAPRRANLARFERSWRKWNATRGPHLAEDDFAAVMDGYHGKPA